MIILHPIINMYIEWILFNQWLLFGYYQTKSFYKREKRSYQLGAIMGFLELLINSDELLRKDLCLETKTFKKAFIIIISLSPHRR